MPTPNQLVIGAAVLAIIFIMIGHVYREEVQSKLKTPLATVDKFNLDWWSVSHFMLFAFFGFVKPSYPLTAFTIGAVFEVFEDGLSSNDNTQLVDCSKSSTTVIHNIMCRGYKDSYWYAKIDDIFMNLIGYVFGQAIRTTFYPNILTE